MKCKMNITGKNYFFVLLILFSSVSLCLAQETGETLHPQAIIVASYRGDDVMVRELLKVGVDKDVRDALGATALHASMFQSNLAVVKLLLEYGFDVNARVTKNGNTPLHYAVASNNLGAAQLLLQYYANKNIKNLEGLTPLDKARREEKDAMIKLLYR